MSTLNELKSYLKFNFSPLSDNLDLKLINKFDILLFHKKVLEDKLIKDSINSCNIIKVLASSDNEKNNACEALLKLPTSVSEINSIIENCVAKKTFSKNSSIKIKEEYLLNKNEKKLSKDGNFIILTEKEIQLLELFLSNIKPIPKNQILSLVWNYSSDADTHTVETHIYRLRKKIVDKFADEKFILNNKQGYYL